MPTIRRLQLEGPYTTTERDALAGIPDYLIIFNSTTAQFEFWNGSAWQTMPGNSPTFDVVTLNVIDNNTNPAIVFLGHIELQNRLEEQQGTDVVAANDLTLPDNGNAFEVTGATQVNAINTTNWSRGSVVTLFFSGAPTVKHNTAGGAGTSPILLEGAVDFVASAGDTLTLRISEIGGVAAWRQIGRAVI